MVNKIKSLKQQRNKLLILAQKQRKVRKKLMEARREEEKLKLEIRLLKSETSKSVVRKMARVARAADTPARRAKARRVVKDLKKGFAAFQKFANKHGEKL